MSVIVLTNLDPRCYHRISAEEFLLHLAAAALRVRTVLMRDQDLACNRYIADLFTPPRHAVYRNLFEELLATGFYRVKLLPPEHFDDDELAELSRTQPIRARAVLSRRKSLYVPLPSEPPYDPDAEPFTSFHNFIDELLSRYPSAKEYGREDANIPARFKAELSEVSSRCPVQLKNHWGFGTIQKSTLETVAGLMSDDERVLEYLHSARCENASLFLRSPRRLFYEIVKTDAFRRERPQLESLAQSIFAAVFCEAEQAEGVYNELLAEPPRPGEGASSQESIDPEQLTIEPLGTLELRPGIGEALSCVRNNTAKGFSLLSAVDTFDQGTLQSAWEHYVSVFAKIYSKSFGRELAIFGQIKYFFDPAQKFLAGLTFGAEQCGSHSLAKGLAYASAGTGIFSGLASLGQRGSRYWGEATARIRLSQGLYAAMQQRCHKVALISKIPDQVSIASSNWRFPGGAVRQGESPITTEAIRHRAYELYEERGRAEGFHEEDWRRAEQELRRGGKSS
jgi:DUF2934 family protein